MSDLQTTRKQLDDVLAGLAELLSQIEPEQANLATPCTEYSVAQLRQHVLGWLTAFSEGYAAPQGQCSDHTAVEVVGDGVAQVEAAAKLFRDASDAAIQRGVRVGPDQVPSELVLPMLLWEYQVHGWDLAVATAELWRPAEAGLAASLAFVPEVLGPDMVGEGKSFAPAVSTPAQADLLDQLVGMSGRDPGWRPAP